MTKYALIAEKVVVTFFEAAVGYLIVVPTVNWTKTVLAGAVGAGLSAVYNLVRESEPTMIAQVADPDVVTPVFNAPKVIEPPLPPKKPTLVQ